MQHLHRKPKRVQISLIRKTNYVLFPNSVLLAASKHLQCFSVVWVSLQSSIFVWENWQKRVLYNSQWKVRFHYRDNEAKTNRWAMFRLNKGFRFTDQTSVTPRHVPKETHRGAPYVDYWWVYTCWQSEIKPDRLHHVLTSLMTQLL